MQPLKITRIHIKQSDKFTSVFAACQAHPASNYLTFLTAENPTLLRNIFTTRTNMRYLGTFMLFKFSPSLQ
jgi:hypothetical protein